MLVASAVSTTCYIQAPSISEKFECDYSRWCPTYVGGKSLLH